MRRIIGAFAVIGALTAATFAESGFAEGKITSIDVDSLMITLDNGKKYKLPGEFNIEGIEKNMMVLIAYDTVNGEIQITDMEELSE